MSKTLHQSQICHWVLLVINAYDQKIIKNFRLTFHVLSLKGNAHRRLHPFKKTKVTFYRINFNQFSFSQTFKLAFEAFQVVAQKH